MRTRTIRVSASRVALVIGVASVVSYPLVAQQVPPSAPSQIAPYRPPAIALVQPLAGSTIPADKPIVVFRFAPGEPGDPLDVSSFRIAVDGADQTRRFQVAASEAWGPIGDPNVSGSGDKEQGIGVGAHQLNARVCSSRGACAEANAVVTVIAGLASTTTAGSDSKQRRKERVVDALLSAIKKVLQPR